MAERLQILHRLHMLQPVAAPSPEVSAPSTSPCTVPLRILLHVTTVFSMLSCLNRGRVGECTLVLKMRHLTFRTEWTCCTTASPKWYRCLGWPSGVCAVFWGKMQSSSAEKSRLYRFPEIQTWCLILVQISLARADLQNDCPKQTVTGALMLPKGCARGAHDK